MVCLFGEWKKSQSDCDFFICNATFIIRKELCSREKEKAARNKSYGLYLFEEVIT